MPIFFSKKRKREYEKRIEQLELQISRMFYAWKAEKELYTPITTKRMYEQKVDWVIGGIDLHKHKEIHRPMYGLHSKEDAKIVAQMVHERVTKEGFIYNKTGYHFRESEQCFVIDLEILPEPVIPKKDSALERSGEIWKNYV